MSAFHRILLLSVGVSLGATACALANDGSGATSTPLALPAFQRSALLRSPRLQPLSNRILGEIRGGFSFPDSNNVMVTFGFAIETMVNDHTVQDIVEPTLTFAPSNPEGAVSNVQNTVTSVPGGTNSETTSPTGDTKTFTTTIPDATNSHLATTIANTISTTGFSSVVQNNVNNQLVQMTRTYNIDISGLQTQIQNSAYAAHVIGSLIPR